MFRKLNRVAMCRSGYGVRTVQGVVAVVVAAFAVGAGWSQPVIAIVAGVLALGIAAMAVTGRCPLSPGSADQDAGEPVEVTFMDARDLVDITASGRKGECDER